MIYITEKKLRAAIQICLSGDGIYTEEREENLVHDIKALATPDEAQSEQLKCLMEDAKPNCDCKLNHCLKNGW